MGILGTMTVSFAQNTKELLENIKEEMANYSEETAISEEFVLAGAAIVGLCTAIKESDEKAAQKEKEIMSDVQTAQDGMEQ